MKGLALILLLSATVLSFEGKAQYDPQDSTFKACYFGSTFFMLGNLVPENKPDFFQLNFGYRSSAKDVFSLEIKTWKYSWSLGIPFGKSWEAEDEKFPGYIRERGFAFAYQRFWWKGLYTGIHVMNAWQRFVNDNDKKIDKGFQVFNTYRLGYHLKIWNNRFFIEPSIAITHRAFHTEMPESFKTLDNQWPKFFIGEPGLHFGYNF